MEPYGLAAYTLFTGRAVDNADLGVRILHCKLHTRCCVVSDALPLCS